eukprot:2686895-Prymnesium_polylepis.1
MTTTTARPEPPPMMALQGVESKGVSTTTTLTFAAVCTRTGVDVTVMPTSLRKLVAAVALAICGLSWVMASVAAVAFE